MDGHKGANECYVSFLTWLTYVETMHKGWMNTYEWLVLHEKHDNNEKPGSLVSFTPLIHCKSIYMIYVY